MRSNKTGDRAANKGMPAWVGLVLGGLVLGGLAVGGAAVPAAATEASPGGGAGAASATVKAAQVNLIRITCYETEDVSAGDEPYIQVNGTTVWSAADSVDCDHDAPASREVNRLAKTGDTVSVYDEDFPDSDDHLGSDVVEGDRGTLFFNLDGALYTIDYGPA
jgi:hypothetical protein